LIERYPQVAVQGAQVQALVGRAGAAERWAAAAERGVAAGTLPDDHALQTSLAMLRAFLCHHGMGRMRADAQAALAGLGPESPERGGMLLLEGIAWLLDSQADRADPILAQAAEVALDAGRMRAAAVALAERGLVAIHHHAWQEAETLAERALTIVQAGRLDEHPHSALVYAVLARTAAHRGDLPGATEHLMRAARLRPLLTYAMPHRAVQTLLELARVYLMLDDLAAARAVLGQAEDILQRRPNLGVLPAQVQELRGSLDTARMVLSGASSLTTAELRLLPNHLTYPEIGQRLYVSQHTVKSQAISIYRKLGVSSRSQAVQRAQELGLLTG
jgi:LuxR family maltose regulon positive regulatory protein